MESRKWQHTARIKTFLLKSQIFLIEKKKIGMSTFQNDYSFLPTARDRRRSFLALPCGNIVGDPRGKTHEIIGSFPQDYITHEFLTHMLVHIQPSMLHKNYVVPPDYGSRGFCSSKLILS